MEPLRIVLGSSAEGGPQATEVQAALSKDLRKLQQLEIPIRGEPRVIRLSIEEALGGVDSLFVTLLRMHAGHIKYNRTPDRAAVLRSYDGFGIFIYESYLEFRSVLMAKAFMAAQKVLARFYRFGDDLYWPGLDFQEGPLFNKRTVTIHHLRLERDRAVIDGEGRPIVRIGHFDLDGFRYVSWSGELVGASDERKYPVYLQSHAFRQFLDRVSVPGNEADIHYHLFESLENPKVITREGDKVWVECRVADQGFEGGPM